MPFSTKTFHAHDAIFREGSPGHAAYILKEGCVEISIKTGERKTVLAVLKPVSVFGEMSLLLKDHARVATATALEYTEVVEVRRENFETFIQSSPEFIKTILSALAERLRHADAKIMRVPDIFVATCEILNLLFEHGQTDIQYDLALSAIANALSLDRTIIREQLDRIEQLNLIKIITNAKGQKTLCAAEDDFLPRAMRIHNVLITYHDEKQ